MHPLIVGIDVGSVAVSLAVIGRDRQWIDSAYAFHHGDTAGTLKNLLSQLELRGGVRVAVTGSAPGAIRAHGRYDSLVSLIAGCREYHAHVGAILHVGGERFGLVEFDAAGHYTRYQTNSTCAAGTGGFLDQQARRLNLSGAGEVSAVALRSSGPPPKIATRCAVFAKTDLAHAQQEGFSLPQICDGLCQGVARHIVDALVRGRPVRTPIVFSGGVSRNRAVVEHLERMLAADLVCEKGPSGAAGAALCLLDEANVETGATFRSPDEIVRPEPRRKVYAFAPLELKRSSYPDFSGSEAYLFTRTEADRGNPVEVEIFAGWSDEGAGEHLLGIDVGSTSTKAAWVTATGAVAAGFYTRTAGNPIGAVQHLLAAVEDAAGRRSAPLKISGAAVTGAGRKLAGRVVGADLVLDEITAHARAACELKPDVDTIIEIGGQDSKFTTLKDGRVNFCVMNAVCAAGTGSFIEEQAQKLDCPLSEYAGRALNSPSPLASDRCTVFMERDINHLLFEGYSPKEILAAVLHSITENYLSKVAAEKHIGSVICFQGATARNQALVAAFEQRLGKPIHVSRFCHLTGAIGAALACSDAETRTTQFRGLELCRKAIPTRVEICQQCANHCKITVADVGGERVASGFLCGRDYDAASRVDRNRSGFSLLKERKRAFAPPETRPGAEGPALGLPAALHMADDLEFWQVFFGALSVPTITSERLGGPVSSGKAAAAAEFCAPMSALHAEVDFLLARADHVFLPFYLERRAVGNGHRRQYCYYTQFAPALSAQACAAAPANAHRVLTPLVHYLYGSLHTQLQLYRMLQSIGRTRIGFGDVYRAYNCACGFKAAAMERLKRCYRRETDGARDIHAVLLGRPYTVLSRRSNKGIPDIFGTLGVKAFFQDMLPDDRPVAEALKPLFEEIHWHYAAAILRAAETAAGTDGAYPVLVTAFRCAPDSFVIEFFKSIMDAHRKPYLILQLDEHGSSVGYETRIEAAVRSFQNHYASRRRQQPVYSANLFPRSSSAVDGKTLLLPDWDHLSLRLVASNLKREGIDARLLSDTPEAIRRSLRHNSGQCIPANIVAQNFIDHVAAHGLDPSRCLLWMIPSSIACNLRMYPHFAQNLLAEHGGGFEKARVYLGSLSFAEISTRLPVNIYLAYMLGGLVRKIGCKIRPYETVQGATDAAIEAAVRLLESAFLGDIPKEEAVRKVADLLAAVPIAGGGIGSRRDSRPKVAIFGDLYSRDNDILNQDLIHFIERHGGEVVTLPYSSYAKMLAWPYMRKWFIEGDYLDALTTGALFAAVSRLEKKYRRPLVPLLKEPEPVYDESPEHILGKFGLRPEHTGESMDNLLKIHYTLKYHPDLALLVQASPAFCCPALVTEAMAHRIERVSGVPMVSVTYDGTGGSKNDVIVPYLKYARPRPALETSRKTR
ncbi:MAG: CoA activase [Deltaproteobacteria bacterium]|nr:CoA activase [Deltaproteobacteria bacterium]